MRLDSHIDDKIPHIYIINLIIKYNDDVGPLGIENNRSIFPLCKFAVNLLFFVVKSYSLFFVVTCAISGSLIGYPVEWRPTLCY